MTNGISRRDVLRRGALLGAGTATLTAIDTLPAGGRAPRLGRDIAGTPRYQDDLQTLTFAANGTPSDLDPHSAYDYRSVVAILGAYEGLIGLVDEKTDQYEGLIAESWESNADKSVWTFHLRDGVTFHDGSPVDAEAVRLSFERFLTLGIGPVGVIRRFVENASQITAPDARTVVFDLGRPQPLFEAAIASTYGPVIVNAKLLRDKDGEWGHDWAVVNEEGSGSGPYKIVEYTNGVRLVMEKFDGYWRGWEGDHFDRVVIRTVTENETRRQLIETGEADIVDDLTSEALDALKQHPEITVLEQFTTQVQYFYMSVAGPLATPEARQAMCWAFPYDEVIQGVHKGVYAKQARGAVPEVLNGFNPDVFTYTTDLVKAKDLLTQAGVAEGTELTMEIETGDEDIKTEAQLFQANLAEIGIQLKIEQVDLATHTATIYGDASPEDRPNFMSWGWWPDYNDAWNHLDPQIACDKQGSAGSNAGFYCNQRVDELMKQSKDEADLAVYNEALAEVQQIVSRDDPPSIFYAQPLWTTVARKDITNVFINPINIGTFNYWKMSRTME